MAKMTLKGMMLLCVLPLLECSAAVTYDQRSLLLNGSRQLLLSGAVHYPRVPRSEWNNVFALAKELHLNTIQTYLFWNQHEPHAPGNWSWNDNLDLVAFIEAAADHDLLVSLRIGPYVCGEFYFGGLPV